MQRSFLLSYALDKNTKHNKDAKLNDLMLDALSSVPMHAIVPRASITTRPDSFTVQLPEAEKPLNQGASGRCWIFSGLNVIGRLMAANKITKTSPVFELSHSFVFFHAWLEKCNSALETAFHMIATNQFPSANYTCMMRNTLSDGGTWDAFTAVIEKHGVVPASAYPDTVPAKASTELNQMINIIIRTAVADFAAQKRSSASSIKKKAMARVRLSLIALLGPPPESIAFNHQATTNKKKSIKQTSFTPREFFDKYVRPCLDAKQFVCVTDDPRKPRLENFWTQYGYTVINDDDLHGMYKSNLDKYVGNVFWNARDSQSMQQAAKRSLDKGCPVWFSCDVRKFYSNKSQVLNASASHMDVLIGDDVWTTPKGSLYDTGVIENLHAMTFVGYDHDTDTWKVENSWGEVDALVMSSKWFERFVVSVVVPLDCLDANDRTKARTTNIDCERNNMAPVWDMYASPQLFSR